MEIKLEDKYKLSKGIRFLTGAQALVRVPIVQARRDKQKNLQINFMKIFHWILKEVIIFILKILII